MEQLIFPILVTLAGAYFLIRNIIHIRNEEKIQHYVETSPKARLWVKKYGEEKTIYLTKKYFLPLGILVSALILGMGLLTLSRLV
jgi:outer membrane lipoprotein-sorting protein